MVVMKRGRVDTKIFDDALVDRLSEEVGALL